MDFTLGAFPDSGESESEGRVGMRCPHRCRSDTPPPIFFPAIVKDETAFPFGVALRPFDTAGAPRSDAVRARAVGRCRGCYAYACHLCAFDGLTWTCALCGGRNGALGAGRGRYVTDAARAAAPDLHPSGVVDVPDDGSDDEDHDGDDYGAPPFPLTHTLAVLADGAPTSPPLASAAADAIAAAGAGLPPRARLGVAAASGGALALVDGRGPAPALRGVPLLADAAGPPAAVDPGDVLPLAAFLGRAGDAGRVGAAASAATAAAAGAATAGHPLGPALQALLAYLAAEIDAESGSDTDGGEDEARHARPPRPPPPRSRPPPLTGVRVLLLLPGPPDTGRGAGAGGAAFWRDAGAAAAALGAVVDVFVLLPDSLSDLPAADAAAYADLEPLATCTGGALRLFECVPSDPLAPAAAARAAAAARGGHAVAARLRVPPTLTVTRAFAGPGAPAGKGEADVARAAVAGRGDALAFDLAAAGASRLGAAGPRGHIPPAVQAAVTYWALVPTREGRAWRARRRLRILSARATHPPAPDAAPAHAGADPATVLALLVRKAVAVAAAEGGPAARAALRDWLVVAAAARAHVDDPGDPEGAADGRLGGEPALAWLPAAVGAVLAGPLLRGGEGAGAHARLAAAAAAAVLPRLAPAALAAAVYPRLSAWAGAEGERRGDELPLRGATVDAAPGLAWLAEAWPDTLLLCPGPPPPWWPPPAGSALRAAADAARARAGAGGRVRVLCGDAAAAALSSLCVDDAGKGVDRFLDGVGADARALLRGAGAAAP